MRKRFFELQRVWLVALSATASVSAVLLAVPLAFSGYRSDEYDTTFWYLVSESGGVYGTLLLVLLIGFLVTPRVAKRRQQIRSFAITTGFLMVTLGTSAWVNEYVIKPLTRVPRPSHQYVLRHAVEPGQTEVFYGHDEPGRQQYLREFFRANPDLEKEIMPRVREHWIREVGYSFPSGHSENAFLLSTILGCWLVQNKRKKWLLLVPFFWAVLVCLSRVAVGVHSELDVATGALIGTSIGLLLAISGLLEWVFDQNVGLLWRLLKKRTRS